MIDEGMVLALSVLGMPKNGNLLECLRLRAGDCEDWQMFVHLYVFERR